jgi:hypothetical protein
MTIDYQSTQIKENKVAYKIPPKSKVVSIKLKDNNNSLGPSLTFSHPNKENIHPHTSTHSSKPSLGAPIGSISNRNNQNN